MKEPVIIKIPNPKLDDKKIQEIQERLTSVSWLDYIYGRAKLFRETQNDNVFDVPKTYRGQHSSKKNAEYGDVFTDDLFRAVCFFLKEGKKTVVEPQSRIINANYTTDYSLIVWGDLFKIDQSKNYDFNTDLQNDVLKVLNNMVGVLVTSIEDESAEEVFRGTDFIAYSDNQNFQYPKTGFRIYFTIGYNDIDC